MGRRFSWYAEHAEPSAPGARTGAWTDQDAASSYIAALLDRSAAVSPDAFLARRGKGLQEPGPYLTTPRQDHVCALAQPVTGR
jgi:hypothetical protein